MSRRALPTGTIRLLCMAAVACVAFSGCRARELGATISSTQALKVDHTWIVAARSCWPALNGSSDKSLDAALLDPLRFRAVFSVYAGISDGDIESVVAHSIDDAPDPDLAILRDAATPVITRNQATHAAQPGSTATSQSLLAHTDAATVPPDALCAIHSGSPVGFR